jgi:hypothetical protein
MKKIGKILTVLFIAIALSGAGAPQAKAATYTYSGTEQQLISYLLKLVDQLQAQIEAKNRSGQNYTYNYVDSKHNYGHDYKIVGKPRSGNDNNNNNNDDEADATTDSATDINDDSAELNGEVDMNDAEDGEVFFVYGLDEDMIAAVEDDFDSYSDVDEDGDDLQKVLVDSSLDDDEDYTENVTNLEEDEEYFFQICVGYEDEDNDDVITCGGVEDFTTDDNGSNNNNNDGDEPEVNTLAAKNIEDDEAELHGEVDMNDFEDGLVFFVYGQDEDQVADIADDFDTYSDIDEDGDDLQKMQADSGLDDYRSYWELAWDLEDDTDYYFQICVEYEDEDNDDVIICGGVEDFQTDN